MTTTDNQKLKQGAAIGGWICFVLGAAVMYYSVWIFILYVPLFFAAFVLSITAMAQRRIVTGVLLLVATLVVPPIQWFALSTTRLDKFMQNHPPPNWRPTVQPSTPEPMPIISRNTAVQQTPLPRLPSAPAPTPDRNAAERASIDAILQQPLGNAHAWQIKIAYNKLLSRNVPFEPKPIFSGDGESVMYPQQQGDSIIIIVASLRDHAVLTTWRPPAKPTSWAWSQDSKRLAYNIGEDNLHARHELHVMDWNTRKDIRLPVTDHFGSYNEPLVWVDSDKLACVSEYYSKIYILNLDTLKVEETMLSEDNAGRKQQIETLFGASRVHPYCKILQDGIEGSENNPFLFVSEKDNSYSCAILNKFYNQTPFYVSPDLRHILVFDNNSLAHLFLGLREAPVITFRLDLNNRELLNAERRADFQKYIQKRVPFWGKVYAPLTNPLNGKLIGPDPKLFKGLIRVSKWYDTYTIVKSATELIPMQAGDIVTDIASEHWGEFGNWAFEYKDEWRPLQPATASAEAVPRQTQSPSVQPVIAVSTSAKLNSLQGEKYPETRTRRLFAQDIQSWNRDKLRYAINEMYARNGLDFTDKAIAKHFRQFSWYSPNSSLSIDAVEAQFTEIEAANVKLLGESRSARRP